MKPFAPRRPDLAALLAAFRAGKDTMQIAGETGLSEAAVYNGIHMAREDERRRRLACERTRKYYAANRHAIKLRRCGIDPNTARASSPFPRGLGVGAELLPSPDAAFYPNRPAVAPLSAD